MLVSVVYNTSLNGCEEHTVGQHEDFLVVMVAYCGGGDGSGSVMLALR